MQVGREWGNPGPIGPKTALVLLIVSLILIGLAISGVIK